MNPLFTASQIANALGITRQLLAWRLRNVPADGKRLVNGIEAQAWQILSLPQEMISQLEAAAKAKGFRNAEELLRADLPPIQTPTAAPAQLEPDAGEEIPGVSEIVARGGNPEEIWNAAVLHYHDLLSDGWNPKRAARKVREQLAIQAPQIAPTVEALAMSFKRKLAKAAQYGRVMDGRKTNGKRYAPPQADIDRLRHSAFSKNSGRMDAAWREEYEHLSDYTRKRYVFSYVMPEAVRNLVNRELTAALVDRHQGRRKLVARVGGVKRDWSTMRSMHLWVVDDMTANIETALKASGESSLICPQIIAVMDSASRKWVGWAVSPIKAPTAELVCEAVLNAIKNHGVPKKLGLENGFVFGRSLNVNGRVDKDGRTNVGGLAAYGCTIHHFGKMNPRAKAELEKSFDLVQRLMERHPGYTGRLQMLDAPEQFKREQQLIRREKIEASDVRYTFEEFRDRVLPKIVETYNNTPREALGGISPNDLFIKKMDLTNPPITFGPELHWYLANERYRVRVETKGVSFTHFGKPVRVKGGRLPEFTGRELWALVDRQHCDVVTFMKLDFTDPFTMDLCRDVLPDEANQAPGSGVLASERRKIAEHVRFVTDERNRLLEQHGNPRIDLLAEVRAETLQRENRVDSNVSNSAAQMKQQRAEIREQREVKAKARQKTLRAASRAGAHPAAIANLESLAELNKLANDD